MQLSQPVTTVIPKRFSCRTYRPDPIQAGMRQHLTRAAAMLRSGPFGAATRFRLIAATEKDRRSLKGLGTYGFIRGATGFLLGAVGPGERNLEDLGYRMEELILLATDLGLGTCWLGGTFTKSSFAAKMALQAGEVMPAVVSVGYIAERPSLVERVVRRSAKADKRRPWERLFFEGRFGVPLSRQAAGAYAAPLEMVRLGPSASNKQPWRIVRVGTAWHFYLQRTPGYLQGLDRRFVVADLQRVDLGIALCHFAWAAREAGLPGRWALAEPDLDKPDDLTEYTASWIEDEKAGLPAGD